ncbi:hypothetical protein SK128_004457, partial [Halocaridina rubra]
MIAQIILHPIFVKQNNLVTFGMSLKVLMKHSASEAANRNETLKRSHAKNVDEENQELRRKNNRKMISISFTLAMTMGITWLLGFTFIFTGLGWMAVVFTVVNSLQGVGLFFALVLIPARPRSHFLKLIPYSPKKK